MYALSAEHAQAYVQPRLSQKSNLYGTYKKGSLSQTSFFYYIRFKTYREASSCRAFSFTIAFPCSSRNASAARENVADLVEFLRFAAGLVQNELIVGICPVLIEGIAAGKILVQRFCGADDIVEG